jgi:hypothetical protein
MRSASSTHVRAVAIGIVTLILVYGGGTLGLNSVIYRPTDNPVLFMLLAPIFAIFLWLLPGFVTGYIARTLPLRHGLWLGVASAVTVIVTLTILELVLRFSTSIPFSLIAAFLVPIFGGSVLGVFIGSNVAKRRDAP